MLAVPCYLLWRIGSKIWQSVIVSVVRMVVQLLLVGLYMKWLFACNSVWISLLWLLLMSLVATVSVCRSDRLKLSRLLLPVAGGLFVSSVVLSLFVLLLVVRRSEAFLDARWLVPVAGVLLGQAQQMSGVALGEYYQSLRNDSQLYDYLLGNGATHLEAVMPFVRRAMEKALHPMLANMSVMGVILLPGLFYGQLLGGVNPVDAAVYLIVLIFASISVSVISVVLTLCMADRRSFDLYGRLRSLFRKD